VKWAVQPQDRNDGSKDFDIKGPDVVDFDFAAVVVIIIVVVRALDNGLNYCWGCHILHTGVLRSAPVDRSPLSVWWGKAETPPHRCRTLRWRPQQSLWQV